MSHKKYMQNLKRVCVHRVSLTTKLSKKTKCTTNNMHATINYGQVYNCKCQLKTTKTRSFQAARIFPPQNDTFSHMEHSTSPKYGSFVEVHVSILVGRLPITHPKSIVHRTLEDKVIPLVDLPAHPHYIRYKEHCSYVHITLY